jgi:hypothetical protein
MKRSGFGYQGWNVFELSRIMPQKQENIFDKPQEIVITKKTVRFGNYVYQFRNVTGFGLLQAKMNLLEKIIISLLSILFLAGFSLLYANSSPLKTEGLIMVIISLGIIQLILLIPKRQGLILSLNSGDYTIFVSRDIKGIKQVVSILYDFMESYREGSYIVNIDQRNAKIGVGYVETLSARQVGGTINNEPDN